MSADKLDPKNVKSKTATTSPTAAKPKKPSKPPGQFLATFRANLTLAVLAGILAFAGAIGGGVLTDTAQRTLWEQEFEYDAEQRIVDKRIELIEKTILLMSQSYAFLETEKDNIASAASAVAKVATNPTSIVGVIKKNFREQTAEKCKVVASRTEFANIMLLNKAFFGTRTNRAVDKLMKAKPWWDASDKDRKALIDAMNFDFKAGFQAG